MYHPNTSGVIIVTITVSSLHFYTSCEVYSTVQLFQRILHTTTLRCNWKGIHTRDCNQCIQSTQNFQHWCSTQISIQSNIMNIIMLAWCKACLLLMRVTSNERCYFLLISMSKIIQNIRRSGTDALCKLPVRCHCHTVNEGAYLGTLVPRVMTGAWTGVKGSSWSRSSWGESDTSPSRWRSASKWMILLTCEQAWTKVGWHRDTVFEFIVAFTNYVNEHTKLYSLDSSVLEHHQVMYGCRRQFFKMF